MQEPMMTEALDLGENALTKKQRGFAIASLVLGILSILTLSGVLVLGILAISFAIAARDKETKRMCKRAKAGLILGIISIVLLVAGVGVLVGMFFAIVNALQEGCASMSENLSQSLSDSLNGSLGGVYLPRLFIRG